MPEEKEIKFLVLFSVQFTVVVVVAGFYFFYEFVVFLFKVSYNSPKKGKI